MKRFVLMLALVALAVSPLAAQHEATASKSNNRIIYEKEENLNDSYIIQYTDVTNFGNIGTSTSYYTNFAIHMMEVSDGFTYHLQFGIGEHSIAGQEITSLIVMIDDTIYTLPAARIHAEKYSSDETAWSLSVFDVERSLIEQMMNVKKQLIVIPITKEGEQEQAGLYLAKKSFQFFKQNVAMTLNPDPKNRKRYKRINTRGTPFSF